MTDSVATVRVTPDRTPAPALAGCASLAVVGLLSGLLLGRADLTAFGTAFAAVAFVAVLLADSPILDMSVEVDSERILEGDRLHVRINLAAATTLDRLDVALALPEGFSLAEGSSPVGLRLDAGERCTVELVLRGERWGLQPVGTLLIRTRDRTGLLAWEARASDLHAVRVLPGPAVLDRLIRPRRTRVHAGNQVARVRATGTEFAEIRPYQPGDPVRSVNWRLTARRGEPWVNDHHPERNTDVVLFLDTFDPSSLADGVRAAAAIAVAYLDQRDRVGLVAFGGSLRWLEPGGGSRQEYRLIDGLITTHAFASEAWRSLTLVPRRCLPPNALVLVVSPLADQRTVAALRDLRARSIDLAVLQVIPPRSTDGPGAPATSPYTGLAERVLALEQDAVRTRLASLGIPVAHWRPDESLAGPLEEVIAFHRRLRTRSA